MTRFLLVGGLLNGVKIQVGKLLPGNTLNPFIFPVDAITGELVPFPNMAGRQIVFFSYLPIDQESMIASFEESSEIFFFPPKGPPVILLGGV